MFGRLHFLPTTIRMQKRNLSRHPTRPGTRCVECCCGGSFPSPQRFRIRIAAPRQADATSRRGGLRDIQFREDGASWNSALRFFSNAMSGGRRDLVSGGWFHRPGSFVHIQRMLSSVSPTVLTQPVQVLVWRLFSLNWRWPSGVFRSQPFSRVRQMLVPCLDSNCHRSSRTFRYVSSVRVRSCPSRGHA